MIAAGFVNQILVAHDICTTPQLKKNGGSGYTYITSVILPGLKARRISDADLDKILVQNPRRVLTFTRPQL